MSRRLDKFDGPIFQGVCMQGTYIRHVNWVTYLGGIYSREGAGGLLKGLYGIRLLLPARIKPIFKLEKNYTKSPNGNKFSRLS